MTTKNDGIRSVHLATGGGHMKAASNGLTPTTLSVRRNTPHEMWRDVKKSDIGAGFAPVDLPDVVPELVTTRMVEEHNERVLPQWKNKFITGASPFIWFYINPKPLAKKKLKAKTPINWKNKLEPKTRARFNKEMSRSLEATANLMVKDILPISLALLSGLDRAQELVQQAVDEKVSLPRDYLLGKAQMATNLRVIRFVSELFNLTAEERKLMALEYTRPWSHS